jgi:hypothetical protein
MGGKKDGERICSCEEFVIKSKKWRKSKMVLKNPKSGFGSILNGSIFHILNQIILKITFTYVEEMMEIIF